MLHISHVKRLLHIIVMPELLGETKMDFMQGVYLQSEGYFSKRISLFRCMYTAQQATIYQVTIMLATYRNVLFPGHNHLLTTSTGDPIL